MITKISNIRFELNSLMICCFGGLLANGEIIIILSVRAIHIVVVGSGGSGGLTNGTIIVLIKALAYRNILSLDVSI